MVTMPLSIFLRLGTSLHEHRNGTEDQGRNWSAFCLGHDLQSHLSQWLTRLAV